MGIIDFLRKILPESLIKYEDRRIFLKDSTLIVGDQKIEEQKIINKIYEEIEKYKDKDSFPFQLIHEDILNDFLEYEEVSIKEKESLKKLKKILDSDDNECIIMARRVVLAEEKNQRELVEKLKEQLDKHHPKDGKKVLNLINAGYFDDLIIPFIEVYKSNFGEEKYIEEYKKFYGGILKFFPLAIFVANYTTEEKIEKELRRRLILNIPFVRLHSIGRSNIEKVENVISKLKIEEEYKYREL